MPKVIACKVPNGLILESFKKVKRYEANMAGGEMRDVYDRTGHRFTARGPRASNDPEVNARSRDQGGYALTEGCPDDLWASWYQVMKGAPMIENHQIMAFDSTADALAWCLDPEHRDVRSGLERIDPDRVELTTGTDITRQQNQVGGVSTVQRGSTG